MIPRDIDIFIGLGNPMAESREFYHGSDWYLLDDKGYLMDHHRYYSYDVLHGAQDGQKEQIKQKQKISEDCTNKGAKRLVLLFIWIIAGSLSVFFCNQRYRIANRLQCIVFSPRIIQRFSRWFFMDLMTFIDFLFPRACINCWTVGNYLCKQCKKMLQPHPEICPVCHRFSQGYQLCVNCRSEKNFFLEGIIIAFMYDALLKKLILRLKYFHKKDISGFLVERLAIAIQSNEIFMKRISVSTGIITHIPSHRYRRHFIKWYNQSELLAKGLSEILHIPMMAIAKKRKHTRRQTGLERKERLKNLESAFMLIDWVPIQGNETILIVDDITTTGSTINELAKTIKARYPKIRIRWAVIGRHLS